MVVRASEQACKQKQGKQKSFRSIKDREDRILAGLDVYVYVDVDVDIHVDVDIDVSEGQLMLMLMLMWMWM